MLQLTTATNTNPNTGEDANASLHLIHFNDLNLAIVRGEPDKNGRYPTNKIEGFYGEVTSALTSAIKHNKTAPYCNETLQAIDELKQYIKAEYGHFSTMSSIWQSDQHNKNAVRGSIFLKLTSSGIGLIRYDKRNLAVVKQEKNVYSDSDVLGYFGTIERALVSVINLSVKRKILMVEPSEMLQRINDLTKHIKELYEPDVLWKLMKGE